MEKAEEGLGPLEELGSGEKLHQRPCPKPTLNRWETESEVWGICGGLPSESRVLWNWNSGPLLEAPVFSLPIFQFLLMHCPNMPALLAGKGAVQRAGWRWRGKGTAMFYPVILYNCVKLQKPFCLLISKWLTWKDWNQTFLVILRIA